MINKALFVIAAAAAVAAASGVCTVALAFTLYAVMRDVVGIGSAGAAASVAGAAALLILIVAVGLTIKVGAKKKPEPTTAERVAAFVKEKPVVAGAIALVAGIVAARNPKMLMGLLAAFLEPKAGRKT